MKRIRLGSLLLAGMIASVAGGGRADEPVPAESTAAIVQRAQSLIAGLESESFADRQQASAGLNELAARPDAKELLAREIDQALLRTDLSFEARARLKPIAARLPKPKLEPQTASRAEIDLLLKQLHDDSPSVRQGAESRLSRLAIGADNYAAAIAAFKAQLARADLDSTNRDVVRELLDRARGVWLLSDPQTWQPAEAGDEQINAWVRDLVLATPDEHKDLARHESARRELIDLLARDDRVERVRQAIATRLEDQALDIEAVARLEDVLDWTKPALVAEFWQGPQHQAIQYLLVDVPSTPEGAPRASHFDRVDDQVAHCVSGNSLSPGDYPVGVFFPHPQQGSSQFHLVNLPTPRRRLMYEFQIRGDDAARAMAILDRTLARYLATSHKLSVQEILMIEELDDGRVSAFTGKYMQKVDDSYYSGLEGQMVGNVSRHHNLCCMLARSGRQQAIPGLMEAIKAKRFLDPPPENPYQWHWVAALCIAVHDPWSDVDDWLAGLVERKDPLMLRNNANTPPTDIAQGQLITPELGATAASILISRHGIPSAVFGVEALMYSPMMSLDCPSSYFRSEEDRRKTLAWWQKQKQGQPSRSAPAAGAAQS